MNKTELTIYRVVESFIKEHGVSPTHAEVAEEANITLSWAAQQIKSIVVKGYFKKSREWRSIELTNKKPAIVRRALDAANPNTISMFIKIALEQGESAEVIDALVKQLSYSQESNSQEAK